MPQAVSTTLIQRDERVAWIISKVVHEDCGRVFFSAETHDGNMAITGSLDGLQHFADSLQLAVKQYRAERAVRIDG